MNVTMEELDVQRMECTEVMESKISLMPIVYFGSTGVRKWDRGICGKELTGLVIAKGIGGLRYCYMCSCHYG